MNEPVAIRAGTRPSATDNAAFTVVGDSRSKVTGPLHFTSVSALLTAGTAAIVEGHAAVIDLRGVTESDSSGLALLIEWMSVARAARRGLRYENIPIQVHQLARLSELEELLIST